MITLHFHSDSVYLIVYYKIKKMKTISKRPLLALICLTCSCSLSAQISITQADFSTTTGSIYRYYEGFDVIPFDVVSTGAGHVWDFPAAGQLEGNFWDEVVQPASLSPFPGVNFVLKKEMEFIPGSTDIQESHSVLNSSGVTFRAYRMYNDYSPDTTILETVPGLPLIQFPATYLSAWQANYSVDITSTLGYAIHDSIHVDFLADGYGTLITPYGTYDCIRLFESGTYWVDSTASWGTADTNLIWLVQGVPVAFMIEGYSTDMQTGEKTGNFRLFHSFTAGMEETAPDHAGSLRVQPNPFKSRTVLEYTLAVPGEVHLEVYDMPGRMIQSRSIGYQTAGTHAEAVSLDGSSAGMLQFRIRSASGSLTARAVLAP